MKRILVLLALLAPLVWVAGPQPAQANSGACTDETTDVPIVIVPGDRPYLAVALHPTTAEKGFAVCYRLPGNIGGHISVWVDQQQDGEDVHVTAHAHCAADPNNQTCRANLGGVGITVHDPITSLPGVASAPPCVTGGICAVAPNGELAVGPQVAEITVYVPLGDSQWVPITLPIPGGCVINFSGSCP